MDNTYWHKQTKDKPLFPDMVWSRPENRQHAGKLLIIGGNLHGFSAPAKAYARANEAGIGVTKVLLPDALKKTAGALLDNVEFAPSTPSGSFSRQAISEWLEWTAWADGVLLAGDLGRNSETAIAIEQYIEKSKQPTVITKDAIDYFSSNALRLFNRPDTTLVLSISQLQKLVADIKWPQAVTYSLGALQLVELLHEITSMYQAKIVTNHHDTVFVAVDGQVSTTPIAPAETWRVETAAYAITWLAQNPSKPFEALCTSIFDQIVPKPNSSEG